VWGRNNKTFDRNGIKFNRPDGEVLKADEAVIHGEAIR
jgi:hypothetical protein